MKRIVLAAAVCLFGAALCAVAQAPAEAPMSEPQFREFMRLLDAKRVDAAAIHAQMEARRKLLPTWFPEDVWADIEKEIVEIDFVRIEYPSVKDCMTEADAHMLIDLFQTPEGQAYGQRIFGLEHPDAAGAPAGNQAPKPHVGLPPSAFSRLNADDVRDSHVFFGTPHGKQVVVCMNNGRIKAEQTYRQQRTVATRQVMAVHHVEIEQAKAGEDSDHIADDVGAAFLD